ncbi:ankyrin-like protein [Rhizoctonia solani AG-3 Rhs1AP]|uniref:Ankyrin-like protein n=1 Tax=Rhizoctonia solani AG-3 Rhs1AP TaxID=1086054 RepID=A0A0A1UI29_9AGAM|nr:ankyrin-like protein [Rhizoctonia solani AG-3 Rhs1AP]
MRRRSSSPNTPSSDSSPSSSDLPLKAPPIEPIEVVGKDYDEARLFRAFINDNAFDSVTPVVQPASAGYDRLHSVLSSAQRYHVPPPTHVVKPSALVSPVLADEEIMAEDQESEVKPNPDVQVVHPSKESCNNLPVRVRNVPLQGAKSRVETQLKVTIDLVWDPTPRTHFHHAPSSSSAHSADSKEDLAPTVGSWEWLSLPPGSATKRRGRKEAKIVPTPTQTLTLHTMVHVASAPHTAARACKKCLAREAKRAERKRKNPNDPPPSELADLGSLGCEDDKIVLYNCADVLDFKNGTVDLPVRLTCYCRHHSEKVGFCITFILRDHTGRTVGTGTTPPIMITDDHKSTARKVHAQQSVIPGGAGLVPPTLAQTGPSLVAAVGASSGVGSRKGSKDKGGAKHRMKPYDRSRASSVGLVKEEAGTLHGASSFPTPSTQGYTSPPPQSPTLFTAGMFGMQSALLGDAPGMGMLSPSRSAFLSPPRSPIHSRAHTRPHSPVPVMSHPPSSNHAPSPSHTNMHSPSHTALHSPIHTTVHSRAHSPTRGILTSGMSNDFMHSLLGSSNGLLGMNDGGLLGMDDDTLMANAFAAGADTQMFDPSATDPTNPVEWEAMLQQLTNQPPATNATSKPPSQGAMYVEHPPWGSSNWDPPAATSVPWPPETIDLAPPETTPIPRVSRVVPNSGPIQGGIEVTLLGENFSRAYECQFGDYVATETALWGGNTLVCLLPPAAQAGAVPVRIKGYESVPLRPGEREVMFTYKDDMLDRNLMELALRVVGQRMTGRQEEPCNIARRIVAVGEMQNNSNVLVTRLAQSIIESDATQPTRQDELVQFLTLLDVPHVGSRGVSTRSAVSLQNETGHTLLHLCAMVGFDALATDLISRGADVDVRDATGQTPLHLAALRGQAACVRVLLLAGADTEIVNAYGLAPVDVAREHARLEVLALLEGADEEAVEEEEEEEEEAELRAPSLDESTGADADESDLDADDERQSQVPADDDSASDDLFADDPSRPSLDSVIDGRPPFLGDIPKVPSTWFHRTFSHLQPQKAWPLPQINLPDIPVLTAWPVTITWPQTPDRGSFDLVRGFLTSKQQPNAASLTVYPPPPQPSVDGQTNVQLRTRLARRLGYYPTEVTDREIRAYTHHSQKMRKLKKDRMLVLFWLPILLIVIAWGLYQSIPVAFKAMAHTIQSYLPLATR